MSRHPSLTDDRVACAARRPWDLLRRAFLAVAIVAAIFGGALADAARRRSRPVGVSWRAAAGAVLVTLVAAGCVATPGSTAGTTPGSTAGTTAEVVERHLECAYPFPAGAIEGNAAAPDAAGPEYDAIRAALESSPDDGWSRPGWVARLADGSVLLLTHPSPSERLGWWYERFTREGDGLRWSNGGQCEMRSLISPGLVGTRWWLDPAYPSPRPETTEIRIRVDVEGCQGAPPPAEPADRIADPAVVHTSDAVTVTVNLRPHRGVVACHGLLGGTPVVVRLGEPLGGRTLLDGGRYPPATPEPIRY